MILASRARMMETEDRIALFGAVDKFRARLKAAQDNAKELRQASPGAELAWRPCACTVLCSPQAANDADSAAIEAKTKFVRVSKKMQLPARMRANAQVLLPPGTLCCSSLLNSSVFFLTQVLTMREDADELAARGARTVPRIAFGSLFSHFCRCVVCLFSPCVLGP